MFTRMQKFTDSNAVGVLIGIVATVAVGMVKDFSTGAAISESDMYVVEKLGETIDNSTEVLSGKMDGLGGKIDNSTGVLGGKIDNSTEVLSSKMDGLGELIVASSASSTEAIVEAINNLGSSDRISNEEETNRPPSESIESPDSFVTGTRTISLEEEPEAFKGIVEQLGLSVDELTVNNKKLVLTVNISFETSE